MRKEQDAMKCPRCEETEMERRLYEEILEFHGWFFTVEILACPECGYLKEVECKI